MTTSKLFPFVAAALLVAGCSTTSMSHTNRTAMEQLLISNAIDQALDRVNFASLRGRAVFVDDKYLECVDKGYLVGSVRQRVLDAGARLVDKPDESGVVIEVRSGGIGTDHTESYVGMPGLAVPGVPIELPEVRLWNKTRQRGTAKVGLVAYDTAGRHLLNHGGQAIAQSDDSKWFLMGLGPFQDGTVPREIELATTPYRETTLTQHGSPVDNAGLTEGSALSAHARPEVGYSPAGEAAQHSVVTYEQAPGRPVVDDGGAWDASAGANRFGTGTMAADRAPGYR
jgi:hypothetical protein